MPEVYVGLASNHEPGTHLQRAVAALTERFGVVRCSAVYRSAAAGPPAPHYWNLAATFVAACDPASLAAALRELEHAAGRRRDDPALVTLDLDLLLYGCRVDPVLRVPRSDVLRRPFVLLPLAELAPALVHPVTGARLAGAAAALRPHAALARLSAFDERPAR